MTVDRPFELRCSNGASSRFSTVGLWSESCSDGTVVAPWRPVARRNHGMAIEIAWRLVCGENHDMQYCLSTPYIATHI